MTADNHPATDPLALFNLQGKVALVTGASSGLGERFARVLASVGATVVITARRADRLDNLVEEIVADGGAAIAIACDVGDPQQRERLIADALDQAGRLDILVNNAGVSYAVGIEQETLDQFETAMNINTVAVWHLSKLVAPHMIERGSGSIINIASMLGHIASTPIKQANYCASKGAVVNMTRELAAQLGRKGITVNAICPGYFPSEMTAVMVADDNSQKYVASNAAIPRMGEAHELDGALLLLAGDAGTYITGQSIIVDGGFSAR